MKMSDFDVFKQRSHSISGQGILRLQAFPRESKDKDMTAMLVVLTIDANEGSFVKIPPTWPR